jgi:uncharacterized protein YfiM (DUF2279 family)
MQLIKWLLFALATAFLAILFVIVMVVDGTPIVRRSATISPDAIAQAKVLIEAENAIEQKEGAVRKTSLPLELIDQGINYVSSRYLQGRGDLRLSEDHADIRLSIPFPMHLPNYFNVRLTLAESEMQPRIIKASLGSLHLPPAWVELALNEGINRSPFAAEWKLALKSFRRIEFDGANKRVDLSYVWAPAILDKARALAFKPDDIEAIRKAQITLAEIVSSKKVFGPVLLVDVLNPMLQASSAAGTENQRASLIVLAAYLANKDLSALIPAASNWPVPRIVTLNLQRRHDSAQHFIISAALAAWGGEPVADAIGLYKEVADAQHGSGFSFADLAADRAGTRFGSLLRSNPTTIQNFIASKALSDSDIAPKLDDLPENMAQPEFEKRFGGPGQPAYQDMLDKIENRLANLPLYLKP